MKQTKIDPWINVRLRVSRGKRYGGHTPFIHMNGSGHAPSLLEPSSVTPVLV